MDILKKSLVFFICLGTWQLWGAVVPPEYLMHRHRIWPLYNRDLHPFSLSINDNVLISSESNNEIIAWHLSEGRLLYSTNLASVPKKIWSLGSSRFAIATGEMTLIILDWNKKDSYQEIGPFSWYIQDLVFSPHKSLIYLTTYNEIIVLDSFSGEIMKSYPAHEFGMTSLVMGPGHKLISAGADQQIMLWDPTNGDFLGRYRSSKFYRRSPLDSILDFFKGSITLPIRAQFGVIRHLAISGDGHLVSSGTGSPHEVLKVWTPEGQELAHVSMPYAAGKAIFYGDGQKVIFAGDLNWDNGYAGFFELDIKKNVITRMFGSENLVTNFSMLHHEKYLLARNIDGYYELYETASGHKISEFHYKDGSFSEKKDLGSATLGIKELLVQ